MDDVVRLRVRFALEAARGTADERTFWDRAFSYAASLGGWTDDTFAALQRLRALGLPIADLDALEAFTGVATTSPMLARAKREPRSENP